MGKEYQLMNRTEEKGYPQLDLSLDETVCPKCGSDRIHVNSNMLREFNDVDENGNYRKVNVHFARYKCRDCGSTFSPLPKNLIYSYTPEFRERVIEDYYNDIPVKELSLKYHIPGQNIRKFIREFLADWEEKNIYEFPWLAGLIPLNLKSGRFFALTDMADFNILDILTTDDVKKLDWSETDSVFLAGTDFPEEILEKIGSDKLIVSGEITLQDGYEALIRDAKNLGITLDNLSEILKKADSNTPYEEIVKFPKLMPVFLAARDFNRFIQTGEQMEEPNALLSNFKNYLRNFIKLDSVTLGSGLEEQELGQEFSQRAKAFKEAAETIPKSFNTKEKIKGRLLYSQEAQPVIKDNSSGEILLAFGKRI